MDDSPNINIHYYNIIGILHLTITNTNYTTFKNLMHKCEDGLLTVKIILSDKFYQFSILISSSMCVNFKESKVTVKPDSLDIRYYVTKNLNVTNIFSLIDNGSIFNCINIPEDVSQLKCLSCDSLLYANLKGMKFVSEFNYNYIENLEILSCHEHDINNIIPNIDDKLKRMYV
jgi:hypothetical protein